MRNPIKHRQRILRLIKPYNRIMSFLLPVRNLVICWCLAASSSVLFAQSSVIPQGNEYKIAGALVGDQTLPHVAIAAEGGYLVWQDNSVSPLGPRIRAARLDGNLISMGAPFVVSSAWKSKTAGDQEKPQVALLPSGGAVIVWQGGKAGLQQIYARFIAADGTFLKSDIRVGTHPKNNQINPVVAVSANGIVAVVWSSVGQDGNRHGVFAQLMSSTGAKIGTEFQVNQFFPNNQRNPVVVALANGNFAISWVSELQRNPSSSVDVFARIFTPTNAPFSDEFSVSISTTNACANPSIAASSDGGFAIAWSQKDDAGRASVGMISGSAATLSSDGWDIFASVFAENGSRVVAPFRVNETRYGDQYVPRLSAQGTNLLAVWTSLGQDGSREGIYAQTFAANGDFQGSEFRVNTTTVSRQIQPAVASNGQNRFLAVWSSAAIGTGFDLFGQTYLQTSGQ
jgi:hypothetical protein